jgi:hypothetical protein
MARLGAHGTEVFRLVKETEVKQTNSPIAAKSERLSVSIRSDLAVLKKRQVLFPPLGCLGETADKWHDYGWKLAVRGSAVKAKGHTTESLRDFYLQRGYKLAV